ncbi:tRNA (adenosine(37)-N6)-dimethylallyltransferase MiaA [Malikia spinosa]|uniref:tRNA dimethylallyltransferase n=1 Tax=Malikia spinosa TaxID=86180 RepID=A0A2S9KDI1_9BURK|nr:tRNA (adenosine(37)-N6)-dimethylallyltransferase MiaA [Malikia spinosa]PRD68503.1 tRNA (adenosine(37)-N6)-dimethylallyltransferase MiaA [Malikia spinosa]
MIRAPASAPDHRPGWLAIAGPTASGKTALALALAQRWPVEIISVDSALVFRGMDIGTAKPSAAELASAPHHLIDIRDPLQAYSAAEFVHDATALLGQIRARGRLPLLVGGTMLYFKALFEGLDAMPSAQPALRAEIEAEASQLGWPALHAQLSQVDPVTAARLSPNDSQRIGRALEVWRASGRPISAFHTRDKAAEANRPLQIEGQPGLLLSLEPVERAWLHQRIAQRFDAMLAQGFIDEMTELRARGDLTPDLSSMRCVGYRQAWEALDAAENMGRQALNAQELAELHERGIFATRQLAKRQLTWLRSMPQRQVVACDQPGAMQQALELVEAALRPETA